MRHLILMTGATGLLGSACLQFLMRRHGAEKIVALVRPGRDTSGLRAAGVQVLEGNIAEPDLGLVHEEYDALTSSVRVIVNCAADIRFNIPLTESRAVNVGGTANLLELGRRCKGLQKFAQASTVYVWGGKNGEMGERPAEPDAFFNPYQQSKFEAEQLVTGEKGCLPASIYRFSTMVYDGEAGRVKQVNYFHQLLRLTLHNPLQMIPADGDAKVDLIFSDWAARVFAFLLEEHFQAGEIVHIAAGSGASMSITELLAATFAYLPITGTRPQLVTQQHFDRLAASILTTASRRKMWRNLNQFLPHMNIRQSFATATSDGRTKGRSEFDKPNMHAMFPQILEYCLRSHWGLQDDCAETGSELAKSGAGKQG